MKRLFNKCCSIFVAASVVLSVATFPSDIGAMKAYAQDNVETAVTYSVTSEIQPGLGSIYDVCPSISFFGLNSNTEFDSCYRNQLDTQSQAVYDKLYEFYGSGTSAESVSLGISGTFEDIYVSNGSLTAESEAKIDEWAGNIITPAFLALIYDHPELSWLCNVEYGYSMPSISVSGSTATVVDVQFFSTVAADTGDISDINTAVATAKSAINADISNSTIRYNIVKGIHDYLCENIEYNDTAADDDQTTYNDDELRCYQTAYSAFYPCNGDSEILTVCAGYARGFKVLCDSYGIPCIYVTGDAGTSSKGPHAWNYVQMDDDKWYAIDATWDDQGETDGVNDTRDDYFLSGSDTVGFDSTTFTQSHTSSGNWTSNELNTMLFFYPELETSAYVYSSKTDIATTTVTVSEHAYNESEQSPTIIVKNGDTTLVQDTDYTVTGTTSATDGGTYTVTLTGIGNYSGTKTVEWTIEQVTPQFTYTKSITTYNGTAQQLLTVDLLSAGCVVKYSFDRTNWSTDIPTKTDAGTYRVYYRIIGTNNYSDYSANFDVTILKATPAINVTATPAQTSIGKAITVTATVFNHDNPSLTDTPTPEFSYKIGSNDAVAFTGSFTIPAGTATGTNITITASTAESDNYFPATSPTTVSVIDCPHDGENTLEWDTDSHWYECGFCGATLNSTVHSGGTATCTDKAVCSTCNQEYGDVDPANHGPVAEWTTENGYHWHECACGEDLNKAACSGGTATCTSKAVCSTCNQEYGNVDPTNHAGEATEWTTENGYHWHECACGEDLNKAACSGGTATCTDKAVCSTCNQEYGNLDADNHIETVPEWSKDSTNHWYTCDCGSVISAAHTSSGAATDDTAETCTVCGYIITPALSHTTHTADTSKWYSDGTNHWHKCTGCEEKLDITAHSGGTATCTDKAVCSACEKEYGTVDSNNHSNKATEWTTENGYHWHECACGADVDKAACAGGTATCTAKAKCAECNTEYGTVDSNNHSNKATEWTKDETGHWHICDCGKSDFAAHTSGGAATEDTAETCTVCGYVIAPATGHITHTADTSKWFSDGTNHWHKCTGCEEKMDITAHSGGTATCTAKAKCAECNTEYGTVDSNNHSNEATEWTKDKTGHWHVCECGKPDFAAHTSSGAATPTTAEICKICNFEIAPATGYVAAPSFKPVSGTTFTSTQKITIACATEGAKIYYTTNGTEPTTASTLYEGAITISKTTTIKAIAVKAGMGDSVVSTAKYIKKSSSGGSSGSSGGGGSSSGSGGSGGFNGGSSSSSTSITNTPEIDGKPASWTAMVSDISKLSNGSSVTIELNGNDNVPAYVIKQIANNGVKAIFVVNGSMSWSIDGAKIKEASAIDLGIIAISSLKTTDLRGEVGAKFRVDGTNASTSLIVSLNKKNTGKFANLYKKVGDKLVFVDNVKINANGNAILPVCEQGDYALMVCDYSDRKGDVSNDGMTNALDASAILRDIVKLMAASNPAMLDYNNDGRTNALDASAILIDIVNGVI